MIVKAGSPRCRLRQAATIPTVVRSRLDGNARKIMISSPGPLKRGRPKSDRIPRMRHSSGTGERRQNHRSRVEANKVIAPNIRVSDGSQPPRTCHSSPSKSAGSRSLCRLFDSSPVLFPSSLLGAQSQPPAPLAPARTTPPGHRQLSPATSEAHAQAAPSPQRWPSTLDSECAVASRRPQSLCPHECRESNQKSDTQDI